MVLLGDLRKSVSAPRTVSPFVLKVTVVAARPPSHILCLKEVHVFPSLDSLGRILDSRDVILPYLKKRKRKKKKVKLRSPGPDQQRPSFLTFCSESREGPE